MSIRDFIVLYVVILATMLVWRCVPLLALRGRELPERVGHALELIPAAAFAALVANDLLSPAQLMDDPVRALVPFAASAVVLVVARRTRSPIWCAVAGMAAFALLTALL